MLLCFGSSSDSTDSVGFLNHLIDCVGRTCAGLADKRQGGTRNSRCGRFGLAGFSPFLMPFVSVAPASDLRRDRTRALELPDPVGNGAHSYRQSHPSHVDDVEPSSLNGPFDEVLAAVERAESCVVDQAGRPYVDRDGWNAVLRLEQAVVSELLEPHTLLRRRPIITESTGRRRLSRHCEELLRRSNPRGRVMRPLDCFAALAMTAGELARLFLGIATRPSP